MKKYFLSLASLLGGTLLLITGLRQFNSKDYYAEMTSISGNLEYLEMDELRYSVRYNLGLQNDRRKFRIPGITSRAFDFENFQKQVNLSDPIELLLNASDKDDNQEIIGISSGGIHYINEEIRNSLRKRNGVIAIFASLVFLALGLLEIR